jgi:hypothetical protein
MSKFFDAMLFKHAPIPGVPRVGRIFPPTLWPKWDITAAPPDKEALVRQAKAAAGCPIIYFDEINSPHWNFGNSSAGLQEIMDKRAAMLQIVRDVVGKDVKLLMYNFPVFGDTAARNVVNPWTFDSVHAPNCVRAIRCKFDVRNQRIAPSKLYSLLDGMAPGLYWDNGSAAYLNISEKDAFADSCDMVIEIVKASGLPISPLVRVVSPTKRIAVPDEICDVLTSRFENIIVWEGEDGVPADAPMIKRLLGR